MSELIKHECGIALVRLRKPLGYFQEKYGTPLYGFNQLFLLMEKQHNRGQDGAGIGCVKLGRPAGEPFMFRERDIKSNPLVYIFNRQLKAYSKLIKAGVIVPEFPRTVKEHFDFGGELLVGHLRYGTSGAYSRSACHPYFRRSPWPTRNLMLVGNFNMTNADDLNRRLINRGAHPIFDTDTQTVLEEMGYHLDEEHQKLYHAFRDQGVPGAEIPLRISGELDLRGVLEKASRHWDGGYAIAGLIGNGDAFVMRDPMGIRPVHYFADDEVIAVASERVALMTIFRKSIEDVKEVPPGGALLIQPDGSCAQAPVREPRAGGTGCSFERIYFSRGNDHEIYRERKALGAALASGILAETGPDLNHAVFSYIPNTAESAYYGLMEELRRRRREEVKRTILEARQNGGLDEAMLDEIIMAGWPRGEKIAHKDIKLRTFISQEKDRLKMASHVYDITYGIVTPDDALVCVDDSIVRGTTLKQSIIRILSRARPRKIVIASTAPQIRYPDCYGIDMSQLGKFIAFQAAISLCKETGKADLIKEVYRDCVEQAAWPAAQMVNHVKRIYEPFSAEQLSRKITELVTPPDLDWHGEVRILYQSIEDLHASLPRNHGDWYFTGNYPTPGGYKVLNRACILYFEKRDQERSY